MTEQTAADQIDDLAEFIMQHVPGEPSRSEGAVDTAIRVIQSQQAAIADLADAIRLTVEYLGLDVLPAQPGWSWYDALAKHAPELLDSMRLSLPDVARGVPTPPGQAQGTTPGLGPLADPQTSISQPGGWCAPTSEELHGGPHVLTAAGRCAHGCDYAEDGDRYHPHRYPESPQVGPHEFAPLSWTSSLRRHRGKCARCYWPRNAHPIRGYVVARRDGDTTGFVQAP
jgi:hypothetical protein